MIIFKKILHFRDYFSWKYTNEGFKTYVQAGCGGSTQVTKAGGPL